MFFKFHFLFLLESVFRILLQTREGEELQNFASEKHSSFGQKVRATHWEFKNAQNIWLRNKKFYCSMMIEELLITSCAVK